MTGSLWNDEQERPAQHLRVIDMSIMLPGPYLTRLLAQYGADVIKIENLPHGDPLRQVENSALFELLNAGKRSVALDLNKDEATQIVRELAGEADVFVENFREGVMERYGLGYPELSEVNPDLIYLSLRGLSGKYATNAAHDLNFIAQSGVGEWFLQSGAPNYSTQFGDIVGGALVPAVKLLFHLANHARAGMHIISCMDEGVRSLFLSRAYDEYKMESMPPLQREDFGMFRQLDGSLPHSRYYKCRDGHWISLNAIQLKHWIAFCEVVDREAWKDRMQDKTLVPEMEALFLDAPSSYWEALSTNRDICLFRVVPWSDHVTFSQARPQLATDPFNWAGFSPNPGLGPAPALGRDTFAVMHSIGITNKQIADCIQAGVAFQTEAAQQKK